MSNFGKVSDLGGEVEPGNTEEADLVRRAQSGDAEAFTTLVRRYQRRAVSVAYRLLGNGEDASDVSQDAFVRAYRRLSQLDDPERFGAWLMRIVTNLSLNFRRARGMRAASVMDDALLASGEGRRPGSGAKLSAALVEESGPLPRELHAAIDAAMAELPEKQRLSLILFSVEGMPQREVAEVLACSVELVKWNVFQARKKLKEMLAAYM